MGTQQSTIIMSLIDGITGPAGTASSSLRNLLGVASTGPKGGALSGFLGATVSQLAGLVTAYKAVSFAKEGFLEAAEEENKFMRLRQRLGETEHATRRAREAMDELTAKFGVTHEEMKAGMEALATSGRSFAEVTTLLEKAAIGATGLGVSVKEAADVTSALTGQMKISAAEMPKAFDMMIGASRAGAVNVQELVTLLPELGAAARTAGMSGTKGLSQLLAILEAIRPNFANSAEAAASLNATMENIGKGTTFKAFAKHGIDLEGALKKAKKEGQNLLDVFYNLSMQLTKGDLTRLPEFLPRTAAAMLPVLQGIKDNQGAWREWVQTMSAAGETMQNSQQYIAGTTSALNQLAEAWRQAKEQVGDELIAAGAVDGLKAVVREIARTVQDVRQLIDDLRLIGVKTGLMEGTPAEKATAAMDAFNKAKANLDSMQAGAGGRTAGGLTALSKQEVDDATEAVANARAALISAQAAAAADEQKRMDEQQKRLRLRPRDVGRVVTTLTTGATGPAPPLEAAPTPRVERIELPEVGAIKPKVEAPDLSPISAGAATAGASAGEQAGQSLIKSLLASVEAGLPGVKAAIQKGLSGITANANVNIGTGASMRDAPTPGRAE